MQICVVYLTSIWVLRHCECLLKYGELVVSKLKKTCFLQNFAANFLLFSVKNAENDYIDQHLECAAPKRLSKYTTLNVTNLARNFTGKRSE